MVDSSSNDEFQRRDTDMMLTPQSSAENTGTAASRPRRRRAGRAAPAATRRARPAAGAKAAEAGGRAAAKRPALSERPNPSEAEAGNAPALPADTDPDEASAGAEVGAGAGAGVGAGAGAGAGGKRSATRPRDEKGRGRPRALKGSTLPPPPPQPPGRGMVTPRNGAGRSASTAAARHRSLSARPASAYTLHRAADVSDPDGMSDSAVRRKLAALTDKFDQLDVRYRTLKDVRVTESESNFKTLRAATDERARLQEDLIASLKEELKAQIVLDTETKTLRSKVRQLEDDKSRLRSETGSLSASLQGAQNEVRALSAKLSATRQGAGHGADAPNAKLPGSAVKAGNNAKGLTSLDSARESPISRLKEELYRDLTDLVIIGVKSGDGEVIYDCLQTGRNGTLHFHLLSRLDDRSNPADYQDTELDYTPLLNEKRDRALLEMLPDYLTEEIQFPRNHAAGFYKKLFENMKNRIEVED